MRMMGVSKLLTYSDHYDTASEPENDKQTKLCRHTNDPISKYVVEMMKVRMYMSVWNIQ
jgi:hypothetical protein